MTVRAGVHENTWGHVEAPAWVRPAVTYLRRVGPYFLLFGLVAATVIFAVSCNGSTVAFTNGSRTYTLNVEVPERDAFAKGLSSRESLPADGGMLFDFGRDVTTSFWMKDTTIPLSIAFIASDGKVLAVKDMQPLDLTPVKPPGEYRYAIETNQGWFAKHGIKPGSRASIDL
ncbi:MAG: DUF192 domain-containing protein [Actinomycetota bacterium]